MRDVLLVSLDMYQEHQFKGLRDDYKKLIAQGLTSHPFLDAARITWGLDGDSAQLAFSEAVEMP